MGAAKETSTMKAACYILAFAVLFVAVYAGEDSTTACTSDTSVTDRTAAGMSMFTGATTRGSSACQSNGAGAYEKGVCYNTYTTQSVASTTQTFAAGEYSVHTYAASDCSGTPTAVTFTGASTAKYLISCGKCPP